MNSRRVAVWCLYDFGNSAFAVLFPAIYGAFYAGHVIGNPEGTTWWGWVVSASMLLVALSAPLLGGVADHAGVRKRMLVIYTLLGVGAVLCFDSIGPGMAVAGFVVGVIANFAFEGGIVFYNAYLPAIAPPSHHGRVSARGFAMGYVGSLVALGVAAPFADAGMMRWVWIALALQWLLAALPAFLGLPKDEPTGMGVLAAARKGMAETMQTLREVAGMKDLRRFLVAYFFYMDGVNTVIVFAGVYAEGELGFSTADLIKLLAIVQVFALVGSLALARATDVRGPRWTVCIVLLWWIGVVVAAFFAKTRTPFWVVASLAGVGLGSIQAASRAFMSRLIPDGREAEFFGFYALCGKTGAVVGPVLFGMIATAFQSQRPAILSVTAFYLVGFVLLGRVSKSAAGPVAVATDDG